MSEQGCIRPETGDLLSAYELGLLEGPDRIRFESHLENCPACLEELYDGAVVSETLRNDPGRFATILTNAATGRAPSLLERFSGLIDRLLKPRVLVPVGAVGAMALMLMIFQPGDLPMSADLALIEPLPYQGLQLRGGAGQNLDQLLAAGMDQYVTGNYRDAAALLRSVLDAAHADEDWADRYQTALFLGLCLLLDERPDEALEPLETATESGLLPIAERGKWYLAQAHLLREDPQASLPLLESLLSSPVYKVQAEAQLQSVREICDNQDKG